LKVVGRRSRLLYGWQRRNAKTEGELWLTHRTSSVHLLLHEKSEAGKQQKDDF
jgi:hypothetical protein